MCVLQSHTHVHCVLKIVPPSFCYNFDIREPILIIFGRNVTKKQENLTQSSCRNCKWASFCPNIVYIEFSGIKAEWYGDSVGNTHKENSSIFSLIRILTGGMPAATG